MALSDFAPPTDNLYKFMAITGLLVIGWTTAGLVYYDHRVHAEEKNFAMLAAQSLSKIRFVHTEETELKLPSLQIPLRADIQKRLGQDGEATANLVSAANFASQSVTEANDDRVWALQLSPIPLFSGIVLVAFGFVLWWTRVQCHETELTKIQIEKAKFELKELKKLAGHTVESVIPPQSQSWFFGRS